MSEPGCKEILNRRQTPASDEYGYRSYLLEQIKAYADDALTSPISDETYELVLKVLMQLSGPANTDDVRDIDRSRLW